MEDVIITSTEEAFELNQFFAKTALSPLYIGLGGCGKTAIAEAYAKKIGKPFISVAMATYTTPSSVSGKAQREDLNGRLVWSSEVPEWFPCYRYDQEACKEVETTDKTKGLPVVYDKNGKVKSHPAVILLDEINQTENCLQGWLLTATLSKIIANQRMHDDVEFIGACNPKEGSYRNFVKNLNPSLGDSNMARFVSFRYEPNSETWRDYMIFREDISQGIKSFLSAHCGIDFDPQEKDETCFRCCTEFFVGLQDVQNILNPVIEKAAIKTLGSRNTEKLKEYAENLSQWDGKKILNGEQKIRHWFDLGEASQSLILTLNATHGKLSESEQKMLKLLINENWRANDVQISTKERAHFWRGVYNDSKIDNLEIRTIIESLEAHAIAKAAKNKKFACVG